MDAGNLFQFGPFCLDATERVLLRDGRLVPLAPKALSTLLVLVRNMGHVVEKHVLMAEVWPDEFVEEGNLAQHVFMLRRALGENPRYIETVPRRGYRFLDAVGGTKPPFENYTENSEVYQAYLRGRFYWSKHTREGLEQAVSCFQNAITLGPHFALAYAGIVDCYLRLATNYLPTEEVLSTTESPTAAVAFDETLPEVQAAIALIREWDSKAAERENRRATELKYDNLGVHQWHAAYLFSRSLYEHSLTKTGRGLESIKEDRSRVSGANALGRFQYVSPTLVEEVQVSCVVARAQIDAGNFDAACAVLERWWTMGEWPRLDALSPHSSGDLLYTTGALAGGVASSRQVPKGQKHAEALLSGAVALFEQLGSKTLSAEGRIELAYCYYREGMFDLARSTLKAALNVLPDQERELKSLSLIRLASFERHAGHLSNSLALLTTVAKIAEPSPWVSARYHLELATILSEARNEQAIEHFEKTLHTFKAIGNHRYTAIAANNYGYFLFRVGRFDEVETHLLLARKLFNGLEDKVRRAQVDESLAQFHLAAQQLELAEQAISRSVETLETGGEEALLAESLTTRGRILSRMGRQREAKRVLDRAYAVAERCGDREGAARALLTEVEEMCGQFQDDERADLRSQLNRLLADSQAGFTLERLKKCQELLASAHASLESK